MFIIKKRDKSAPATFTIPFRGKEITLTVRPSDPDEIQKIIKKNTKYIMGIHPKSKQAVRIGELDNTALGQDGMDYLLVGFTGFIGEDGKVLDVTRENKLLIANLETGEEKDGEPVKMADIIHQKSQELAKVEAVEEKEETKNS